MLAALTLAKRFWWAPIIAGLLIWCLIQRADLARKDGKLLHAADVMQTNEARIRDAAATFRANAEAQARRIETAQNHASQEASGEIETLRARASALAAAYIRVRNGEAAGGGTGGTGQSGGVAHAPGPASGPGALPLVDDNDLLICTENTVKALGWRAWWAKISAIPR